MTDMSSPRTSVSSSMPASAAWGFIRAAASLEQVAGRYGPQVELHAALLDPGQVEQVVDHRQDAVGVLPGGQEQLDLLGRQRPDDLLEQQVDGHLDARQRGLQLVADGRDHVALEPVEQVELGDVHQVDGGADQLVLAGADGHDAGEEVPLLAAVDQRDGLLERQRQVVAPAGEDVADQRLERLGRMPRDGGLRRRDHAQQPARRRVGLLDRAERVDHDDRVRERVDRGLRGLLGAEQPRRARLPDTRGSSGPSG